MFASIYSQQVPPKLSGTPAGLPGREPLSLAEFAYAFSPVVEEVGPDTVVMDVEGCTLRFGSHYELAKQIAKEAKSKGPGGLGCKVNVALAANPDAAIHAAKFCPGITFTAPGEELTCLGALPLKTLQCSLVGIEEKHAAEILDTLRLWGVRTFKEFAELPIAGVSERLGQEGVRLQQLASGKTNRHLKLQPPAPVFENSIELDYAIAELEPLSFILARLLNQICANLNAYALATNAIQVKMKLDQGASHELNLTLPYPMRDHKVFLKLLLLDTEMHPPPAAVVAIAINCEPVKPRLLQTGLFIPLAPEPEKLELMLARLAKLVGPTNIGSPELLNTHRPDAFRMNRFVIKQIQKKKRAGRTAPQRGCPAGDPAMPALPAVSNQQSAISSQQSTSRNWKLEIGNRQWLGFRVFRPPLRAIVQAERGCPREISAWDKNRSVYGKVVCVAGPWRTSGDWWRPDFWARDEWDIGVKSNSNVGRFSHQLLYRIYRELGSGSWFVEGIYD
jgi:protein ImuB